MSTSREPLPESITSLLDTLRGRIRRYVLIEGFATILIWLALVFWIGLALDYVPVTFGASEMPVEARIVLLGIAGLGTLWILYSMVLSRLWVSMPYRSLALLIERRYPQLGECLLTTVEAAESPHAVADAYEQQMLDKTRHDALAALPEIKISELFDPTPLWRKGLGAAFAVVTIGVFALVAFASFQIWISRLALNDQAWPRLARMEVLGIEILERDNDGSEGSTTVLLPFQDKVVKVARGSSVRLLAAADTAASYVPRYATLVYRTADGLSDSVRMQRMGTSEEDEQLPFVYDRKPLIGMANSLEFDVIGYDHKLSGYRIEVVDRPFITSSEVDAVLPEYTELLPRKEVVSGATQLPVGSEVTLTMTTSKPIVAATLLDLSTQETKKLTFDPPVTTIEQQYARLSRDLPLEVSLEDVDGIANEIPYRLKISAAPDMAPAVEMRPIGIGSAITKDARIQLEGRIQDDFGVARSWIEVQVVGGAVLEIPLQTDAEGKFTALIDLKDQQTPDGILRVEPDDKVIITVFAQDKCDLDGEGNIGTADRLQLDVVTPDKLLSLLEGRELDLRRRFEQIRDETVRLREDFTRIQFDAKRFALGAKEFTPKDAPSEEGKPSVNTEELFRKALDLQRLRIQRAYQASKKADGELVGIRIGFEEIRAELTSNRMDTTARKERLEKMIIEPIKQLSDPMHAQLQSTTQQLEALYDQPEPFLPVVEVALEQTDAIILEMERILEKMFDLENFNELMEKMRLLIDAQTKLREETEDLRKQQILDLLD
ncbi:hypothetical protein DTL42_00725 [Bremerella cremea]|uniref:Polyketide synthase n=1 Tax=Bremerella cremea TaxID=1031537 RepID=A0A368KYT6_9BACT|nr:hypothetical protein [Bremerella cremea]RCS55947.1 hypothetical protein DTL42_00725 [Bremerella cremea]